MRSTTAQPFTIDAQVHAYERNHPGRPWVGTLPGPAEVTGDDLIAAMDAVGVDGALLISPWSMYRYDASYAQAIHARHADRIALIKPFDWQAEGVTESFEQWAASPGAVGARVMMMEPPTPSPAAPGLQRILAAGATHGLPVNIMCWDKLDVFEALARRHPDTQLVLDHVGMRQPFAPPPPAAPFADLDKVIALARYPNVAVKITGACTYSHEPFPYPDIWDPLWRIFDAYGLERCLWGTDWTRAANVLTYAEGVEAFRVTDRLSATDRATLMGGSVTQIYGWAPQRRAAT